MQNLIQLIRIKRNIICLFKNSLSFCVNILLLTTLLLLLCHSMSMNLIKNNTKILLLITLKKSDDFYKMRIDSKKKTFPMHMIFSLILNSFCSLIICLSSIIHILVVANYCLLTPFVQINTVNCEITTNTT